MSLACGGAAGLISSTATFPLDLIRRRMQLEGQGGLRKYRGYADVARTVWSNGGLRGFYAGIIPEYYKVRDLSIGGTMVQLSSAIVHSHIPTCNIDVSAQRCAGHISACILLLRGENCISEDSVECAGHTRRVICLHDVRPFPLA